MVASEAVITVPPLPYAQDALEPFLSARTVHYHRLKQERYVRNTNRLLRGTPLQNAPLSVVIDEACAALDSAEDPSDWAISLFEQSSQALNHAQMWESMRPPDRDVGGNLVPGVIPVQAAVLVERWHAEAKELFASGWIWLVRTQDGSLTVESTQDADRPVFGEPLLVMDLWEHAYFLDYPDAKSEYVEAWWSVLANWAAIPSPYAEVGR